MGYFDTHRHSEYSTFDGFGKPAELAEYAKSIGYTALGLTDHGNTNGLVKHYYGCRKAGIKPILGVESYMLPKYIPQHRGYHLCLFAMNATGYKNINTMQYEGEKQKYYNPILTFDILGKYSAGVIATSACVQGYLSKSIIMGKPELGVKFAERMQEIFGDNFYIEIQPYVIDDTGTQENVNRGLMEIADRLGIKCILTSDSHMGSHDDLDTYLKMHEIAGHDLEHIYSTYHERYMPSQDDIVDRFVNMHGRDFSSKSEAGVFAMQAISNLEEIERRVDGDIFESFTESLPVYDKSVKSSKLLQRHITDGLKSRGKYNAEYIARAKQEYKTVVGLHFEDYFLMVEDYVKWAKQNGIAVGPGRGSGCNFLIDYALGITDVDSIKFDLEPRRFLMPERAKMPDIDLDFDTDRRDEVIKYVLDKYKGRSARICSYGLYKVDNLINDLAKVCGLPIDSDVEPSIATENKRMIMEIKSFVKTFQDEEGNLSADIMQNAEQAKRYNKYYDNIIKHFCKLYNKVRYIGTHAAGVAIADCNILERTALRIVKGDVYTSYDLEDMEDIGVIKFDMLALVAVSQNDEARRMIGNDDSETAISRAIVDQRVIEGFRSGNCAGIFQFEKSAPVKMLENIGTDNFVDVVAVNAMNRPGPLSLGVPDMYADNKHKMAAGQETSADYFDEWLGDTYGTVLYQEQVMRMCVDIADMQWDDAYMVSKMQIGGVNYDRFMENDFPRLQKTFVSGCKKRGIPDDVAADTFKKFMFYLFNKGHAVAYSLISAEQMYQKIYYPVIFWYVKMKYAKLDSKYYKYCQGAAKDGVVIFLPHVNYSDIHTTIRRVDGEQVLQQGLLDVKGLGEKSAVAIVEERKKNGIFINYDNFYDRMIYKGSPVNKGTINKLKEPGALQFNKKLYVKAVTQYNTALVVRA